MGLILLLLQVLLFSVTSGFLLYNKWLIFKQCLLLGYISVVSKIKLDTYKNISNIYSFNKYLLRLRTEDSAMNKVDKVLSLMVLTFQMGVGSKYGGKQAVNEQNNSDCDRSYEENKTGCGDGV